MAALASLDVRGEICPYPLFETKKKLEGLPSGATLEVLIDYPLALDNITRWAENSGHQVVEVEKRGASEWRIVLKRA
ncbi:MAG TPA: sulfurtransferase TusA family protein [Trueperaceae bacterium]